MIIRNTVFAGMAAAGLVALSSVAFAAGGGSGGEEPTCTNGKVYDKKTKKCVDQQSLNDQESIFEAGRQLAYNGRYDEAITLLSRAPDQGDARILNMLGYSHRKLGMLDTGIAYYKHSIAVDPQYALVREYYGEALLQKGDVTAARGQLASIGGICGTECEPYTLLMAAITDYEAGVPAGSSQRATW